MSLHRLAATPDTVRWGIFDAAIPPVLSVSSGDTVVIECVSGGPEMMPPPDSGLVVPPALAAIHAAKLPRQGVHLITGPVAIRDAMPGDTLEIRIDAIELGAQWGFTAFRPLAGTLPEDFPSTLITHTPIDSAANLARLPWGPALKLAPFFGVMGVAPPPGYGALNTREPREHGGNIDNKELGAGARLFLPVWVPGANFSAGDGHGLQGDGEVCVNALEMCLTGTFTFVLHKDRPALRYPRAETPTHFISMGMDADLDLAMKQALRQMIEFICTRSALTPGQAYQLCSLAVDFRVTQTVNGEKGVHGMLAKGLLF